MHKQKGKGANKGQNKSKGQSKNQGLGKNKSQGRSEIDEALPGDDNLTEETLVVKNATIVLDFSEVDESEVDELDTDIDESTDADMISDEATDAHAGADEVTDLNMSADDDLDELSQVLREELSGELRQGEFDLGGSELESFESAEIDELDKLENQEIQSIIEGVLFASDKPVSMAAIKAIFKGTNATNERIRRALDALSVELAGASRGVSLEEVSGGFQLRTKQDHIKFIQRNMRARSFKLSGPALETLAIVAYKQPIIKSEIDEIRGVESGHLLRALMERGLVAFDGKSELPGRPMQYASTRKFLEIFGLRNLRELPTLSQIDDLIPEGISDDFEPEKKESLSEITDNLSQSMMSSYSEGEDELNKIQSSLENISTSSEFFEEEKRRQKAQKEKEKADFIRESLLFNENVSERDKKWLIRYDQQMAAGNATPNMPDEAGAESSASTDPSENRESVEAQESSALEAEDSDLDAEMDTEGSDGESDDESEDHEPEIQM